jgi:Tfp pilus assembly protein PilX
MSTALHRALAGERDRGLALPLVIGVTAFLAALMVAAIAFSVGALRGARDDQDWGAALAAAYAGVEEYESRLANDTGYFNFGNPASTFSNPTKSATPSVTLPTAAATNPAFGLGASGSWAVVPGSDGAAQYRYEVDNSSYYSDGTLRLRATGRAGGETRSIVADLKQKGFIDFLYFTDFEVIDPQASDPDDKTNCAIRYPDPRPGCTKIYFGSKEVWDGPVHTNDAMQINGNPSFLKRVTTGWKASSGPNYVADGNPKPTFAVGGDPSPQGTIGMPQTNAQIRKETRTDLPDEVPLPGCLYTGPTSIKFTSDGKMTVISPWTRFTNTKGENATTGVNQSKCGTPGASGLGAAGGQKLDVPANLVVFVQNVPQDPNDPNYFRDPKDELKNPSGTTCSSSTKNTLGYPMANETAPFPTAYGCRTGDLFVEGTFNGRATLSAENYIYVTGDLKYADKADDMLGLIGQNAVWVYNPMRIQNGKYTALKSGNDRTVHAAILSVQHTFMVQNYNRAGNRGTLTVFGAIAQRFRGPVATGSSVDTGYGKAYTYDERFQNTAPPKFLSPVTTTYGITVWVEVAPAFDGAGNAR